LSEIVRVADSDSDKLSGGIIEVVREFLINSKTILRVLVTEDQNVAAISLQDNLARLAS